jgi:nitrite reductase/ring-hydroxylating ferredoxin subunit|tara:strand:+ start:3320 stop:4294 length:975 start_codon:yes stop_codon:yes gene_type:complete
MNTAHDWLVVAPLEHVNGLQPVAVSAGGYEFALFRDGNGVVKALENRCPHRRVPLTLGKIINGSIRCAYHGWTFDGSSGACIEVPNLGAQERISPKMRVAAFRVVEHQGFVCIWVGGGEPTDLPTFDEDQTGQSDIETFGSGVAALAVDQYRDILFDGPHLVFEIPGVRITDFYLGDVRHSEGKLVIDREAEWGDPSKPADIKAVDRALVLRTEHTIGLEMIFYKLMDDAENVLAILSLAYCASRRGTTSFCWRFRRYPQFSKLQPFKQRLRLTRRSPVQVMEALDGRAVSATLVGPSADLVSLRPLELPSPPKIPLVEMEPSS